MMSTSTLLPFQPDAMTPAQLAAVSYLARYTGQTHTLYAYQLRRWFTWCDTNALDPLAGIQRAHIELYIRHLHDSGMRDSSINTMMHGLRGFFRFAHIDGLIAADPAVYARLPKIHADETRTQGLDRLELIRFLLFRKSRHGSPSSLRKSLPRTNACRSPRTDATMSFSLRPKISNRLKRPSSCSAILTPRRVSRAPSVTSSRGTFLTKPAFARCCRSRRALSELPGRRDPYGGTTARRTPSRSGCRCLRRVLVRAARRQPASCRCAAAGAVRRSVAGSTWRVSRALSHRRQGERRLRTRHRPPTRCLPQLIR